MEKFHCPECNSDDVKPISFNGKVTTFGLVAFGRDQHPHGSLHVNLIRCTDCGFTWLKLTDKSTEFINNHQD